MFELGLTEVIRSRRSQRSYLILDEYTNKLKERNKNLIKTVQDHSKKYQSDFDTDSVPSEGNCTQELKKRKKKNHTDEYGSVIPQHQHKRKKSNKPIALSSPFGIDCSPDESVIRKRRFPPEETFEIWHQEPQLNKNLIRVLNTSQAKYNDELGPLKENDYDEAEEAELQEYDDREEEGSDNSSKRKINSVDRSLATCKKELQIKKKGVELLPKFARDMSFTSVSYKIPGVIYKHRMVLHELMLMNVVKRKWKLAYRCFSMLIRIDNVDIRSLWPFGIEILQRLAEEEAKKRYPDLTEYDINAQEYLHMDNQRTDFDIEENDFGEGENSFINKDNLLHQWYANNYPCFKIYESVKRFWALPVPYRFGTGDASPLFVRSQIWNLIMQRKFDTVDEKLSELLLTPPYSKDGMFHYMQGVSYQYRAIILSQDYVSVGINSEKIEKLIIDSKKSFKDAQECNFNISEDLLDGEYSILKSRLYDMNNRYDSEPEDDVQEEVVDSSDIEKTTTAAATTWKSATNELFSNGFLDGEFEAYERNLKISDHNRNPDSEDEYGEDNRFGEGHGRYRNPDSEDE